MRKQTRSLYECSHAHVLGEHIYCNAGHKLRDAKTDTVLTLRLARGEPLSYSICQKCPDFDSMGDPVLPDDRGWKGFGVVK